MKIDKNILEYKKSKVNLGDILVDPEGFVYLVVADNNLNTNEELYYRLLRLRDGDPGYRSEGDVFEYTLTDTSFTDPNLFLESDWQIISKDEFKLSLL